MLCPNYVREIISMRALCQIKLENYVNTEGIMAPKVPRVKKKRGFKMDGCSFNHTVT